MRSLTEALALTIAVLALLSLGAQSCAREPAETLPETPRESPSPDRGASALPSAASSLDGDSEPQITTLYGRVLEQRWIDPQPEIETQIRFAGRPQHHWWHSSLTATEVPGTEADQADGIRTHHIRYPWDNGCVELRAELIADPRIERPGGNVSSPVLLDRFECLMPGPVMVPEPSVKLMFAAGLIALFALHRLGAPRV